VKQASAYASLDNELAMCSVSSIDKLYDDHERSGDGEEEEDKREPETLPSFAEAHAAVQTVKLFFYMHNIGKRDADNILNIKGLNNYQSFFLVGVGGQSTCTQILNNVFCFIFL
jgi:hypothetical protein